MDMEHSANKVQEAGRLLKLLPETFVVVQSPPMGCLPKVDQGFSKLSFLSVSITPEEISVIAPEDSLPSLYETSDRAGLKLDGNWRCFKVEAQLDFGLVGILHAILDPLKTVGISVLAVGTYNTDYFLIKNDNVEKAVKTLRENGYEIIG